MAVTPTNPQPDLLNRRVSSLLAARIGPTQTLCVGLSGGCDSVTLLHLLCQLGYRERLTAVHVHHGLSPHADAWADFCTAYCADLGVPLILRRVAVDRKSGSGLEAAARQARYAVFAEIPGDWLLLAQHRGDQAETLLFNLLRGSGLTGAAGMPVQRVFADKQLLRPLLASSRAEIEAYARQVGLGWIEDESNADLGFSRNYLRHQTLVDLSQRFPAAESALAQAAGHFAEAQGLLDELAAEDWARAAEGDSARLAVLKALSLPRLKNLIRYRLRQLGWQSPVASRLNEFCRQIQTAGPDRHPALELPQGRMFCRHQRLFWQGLG